MKVQSKNNENGFVTIEIIIALTLMSIIFVGAMCGDHGLVYWTLASKTRTTALSKTKENLDNLRTQATQNFLQIISSTITDNSTTCLSSGSCYDIQRLVSDISPCAKYVETHLQRHFAGSPIATSSFFTYLPNPAEILALGGDCETSLPMSDWSKPQIKNPVNLGTAHPTDLDVLSDTIYITQDTTPYFRIVHAGLPIVFTNNFQGSGPYNTLDVARDATSGKIYAYVAAVTPQFQIINVTEPANPKLVGSAALHNVTLTGVPAQGWRIIFYDKKIFLTTRFMSGFSPEFHVFDVSDPTQPWEIGAGYKINTSVYGMVLQNTMFHGSHHQFLYLATTFSLAELKVLDVSDPAHITPIASCDLPGNYQATALHILGNIVYVGRENVPSGGPDLYAFDASDPTSSTFCAWRARTDLTTDQYSRHVEALHASGQYLFITTTNTTENHGQVQIRKTDPSTNLALIATFDVPNLAENALDFDDNTLFIASTEKPHIQTLSPL